MKVCAMLIIYELKKIFGTKYIIIIFLILVLLNAIVCSVTTMSDSANIPSEYIESLYEEYNQSPVSVDEAYEIIKQQFNEQMMLASEAFAEGKAEYELNLSNTYINYKDYTDYDLFTAFYDYIEYPSHFNDKIQHIIDTAKAKENEYRQSSEKYNSFSYEYQLQIIDKYSNVLQNTNITTVYPKGWDIYLQYDSINIFIMLFTIILASNMFIQEKANGFHYILQITQNGRLKTVIAKIIASYFAIIISVIIFILSSLTIIFFINGFSDPFLPVQIFEKINLCPYLYSALDCVLINLFFKIISVLLILNIVMLISLTYHYVISLATGVVILAINFICFIIPSSNIYKYLNVFSVTSASDVILRYRAVPIFNNSIDILLFIFILYTAVILCTVSLIVVLGCKPLPNVKRMYNDNIQIFLKIFTKKEYKKSTYSNIKPSLILFELQKKKSLLVVIALITIVKLIYNTYSYTPIMSSDELIYKEYMTALEGEFTPEKQEYINKERKYISDILSLEKENRTRYNIGDLSYEEYKSYLKEYYYCQARADIINKLYEHADYLANIQNTTGGKAYFIYETGILALTKRNFDPFLILIIILLGTNNFIPEYIQNSSQKPVYAVLKTTKYGRSRLYHIKTIINVLLSAFIYAIYQIIDYLTIYTTYYIPNMSVSLISIEIYQKTSALITIQQYVFFIFICGMLGICIISLFCSVLSQMFKKSLYIYSIAAITLLSPQAIIDIGNVQLSFFNPLLLIMPDKLYCMIINTNIANPLILFLIIILIPFLFVAFITRISYNNYCL